VVFKNNFYTFIKVEYQQNSDIINDVIDYVLCCVLSNRMLIETILLLSVLSVRYHMKTTCTFKHMKYKAVIATFPTKMS